MFGVSLGVLWGLMGPLSGSGGALGALWAGCWGALEGSRADFEGLGVVFGCLGWTSGGLGRAQTEYTHFYN